MKKLLYLTLLLLGLPLAAQKPFLRTFQERTLRVDYAFSGTETETVIALDELRSIPGWAGRRARLDEVPLKGNGQVCMKDARSGEVLYRTSFSTLFQEWQATDEAEHVRRSFENVFLLPMPRAAADVTVELYNLRGETVASLTHRVDPSDILIHPAGEQAPEYSYLLQSGPSERCIDVVIVAEGYTAAEMDIFYEDARAAVESFRGQEPFASRMDAFNFIAVPLVSADSGVSIPKRGLWMDTALSSHFDTFYSDRYLTTLRLRQLHDRLAGIPYEHIIILANTANYGGGGIYNSYTLTTAHHAQFRPVVVHEFSHSFAGLGDEYAYGDSDPMYFPDVEPWEPNLTTQADFAAKWQDMMDVPGIGLFEGGGYQTKGVWRPSDDCRMKTNEAEGFCAVCRRAIERMIDFYVSE